jgi:hypothetical protein
MECSRAKSFGEIISNDGDQRPLIRQLEGPGVLADKPEATEAIPNSRADIFQMIRRDRYRILQTIPS